MDPVRSLAEAPRGMVASPHRLASQAGVEVLAAGGSAVDAAIATSAVLCVVYPHMTSVGGDAFWLIHDARRGGVRFLNGGGRAAARERRPGGEDVPPACSHEHEGDCAAYRLLVDADGHARELLRR